MRTKATATLVIGNRKIKGWLTTEHSASSYGQPVFVDENNQAYNWTEIETIITTDEGRSKGGQSTSTAKTEASRLNGRKGGRPKIDS